MFVGLGNKMRLISFTSRSYKVISNIAEHCGKPQKTCIHLPLNQRERIPGVEDVMMTENDE